jgi:hypothetical protein
MMIDLKEVLAFALLVWYLREHASDDVKVELLQRRIKAHRRVAEAILRRVIVLEAKHAEMVK